MRQFIRTGLCLALLSCSITAAAQPATPLDSFIEQVRASLSGKTVNDSLFVEAIRPYNALILDDAGFQRLNDLAMEFKGVHQDDYYYLLKTIAFARDNRPETYPAQIAFGHTLLAELEGRKTPAQSECWLNAMAILRLPYRLSPALMDGYAFYKQELDEAIADQDSAKLAIVYYVLSGLHNALGLADMSIYDLKKAISVLSLKKTELFKYFNGPFLGRAAYVNHTSVLGEYYTELGQYAEALKQAHVVLDTIEKYFPDGELRELEGYNKKTIAVTKLLQQDTSGVKALISSALADAAAINWKDLQAVLFQTLGIYHAQRNEIDSAESYFRRCIRFMQENALAPRGTGGIATPWHFLAKLKLQQGEPDAAIRLLKEELPLLINSRREYLLDLEALAKAYALNGDHVQSARVYQEYIGLQNEVSLAERRNRTMTFEAEQQLTLLAQEKEAQRAEIERQRRLRNGLLGGSALILLFAGAVFRQRNKMQKEKARSEALLLNILPAEVAQEIKNTGIAQAKAFTMVTVMLADIKDFTSVSETISAELLVNELHACFSAFDNILGRYKIEKIKTIGDAYLCASGLPVSSYTHATDMVNAAIEIRDFMLARKKEKEAAGEVPFELRIGIHTGPVVAGVVGIKKFAYDIWGDTVNTAARLEQHSEAGKINISGATYKLIKDKFQCTHRGQIPAKHKGEIDMYFVDAVPRPV